MASLYEIDAQIMDCIDMETGEIIDEARLNDLQMERDEKIENVALWIKNLDAEAIALKAEKEAFKARQEKAEQTAERLRNWLVMALNGQKMTTTRVAISFRKSERVDINDLEKVPSEFMV